MHVAVDHVELNHEGYHDHNTIPKGLQKIRPWVWSWFSEDSDTKIASAATIIVSAAITLSVIAFVLESISSLQNNSALLAIEQVDNIGV